MVALINDKYSNLMAMLGTLDLKETTEAAE